MTELDLYKFVTNNSVEYHWHKEHKRNEESDEKTEVLLFVNILDIAEFNKMLGTHILDEEGLDCIMKQGYFVFKMKYICEHFDIELINVFTDKEA